MGRAARTHPGVVPVGTSHGRRPPVWLAHEVPWSFPAPVAPQASRRLAIGALALFPNHWVITRPWETTNPWAASDPCSMLGAQLPALRSNLSPWWKWQDEPRTEAPTSAWRAQQGAPGSAEVPGERVGGRPSPDRPPRGDTQLTRRLQSSSPGTSKVSGVSSLWFLYLPNQPLSPFFTYFCCFLGLRAVLFFFPPVWN